MLEYSGTRWTVVEEDELVLRAPVCACGATMAPDGVCLEIGACELADARAVRGASRETAKATRAPAAWTSSGRVD